MKIVKPNFGTALVYKAQKALAERRKYSKEVEDMAASLPRLTIEQLNSAYADARKRALK